MILIFLSYSHLHYWNISAIFVTRTSLYFQLFWLWPLGIDLPDQLFQKHIDDLFYEIENGFLKVISHRRRRLRCEMQWEVHFAGVSKWAGTRYFYPSEIVYSTTGACYDFFPPSSSTLKTTREESKMSNFHTPLFQNSFVLVSWPHSP